MEKLLQYFFDDGNKLSHYEKVIQGRFSIATPAFITNMIMLETRKLDPVHRTEYLLVTADNLWTYEKPFYEQRVYVEQKEREAELTINKKVLKTALCHLYDEDQHKGNATEGVAYHISKHLSIPYQAKFNDVVIQMAHLKDLTSHYQKMF